ncbi:MAG TPA: channel protein TolC, partial [Alphaproteobacteria bacterium]|nr:channel protein TolC [Alphaproteobacteria bacterium]
MGRDLRFWLKVSVALAAAGLAVPSPVSAATLKEALEKAYSTNPQLLAQRAALRATDEEVA